MFPKAKRSTTHPSQPKTAVFQWFALQWPMRPATFIAFCICFSQASLAG
jgi:hypothetical protein